MPQSVVSQCLFPAVEITKKVKQNQVSPSGWGTENFSSGLVPGVGRHNGSNRVEYFAVKLNCWIEK